MIDSLRDPYFWTLLGFCLLPVALGIVISLIAARVDAVRPEPGGPDSRFNLSARTIGAVRGVRRFGVWPGMTVFMLLAFGLGMVETPTGELAFWLDRQFTIEVPNLIAPFMISRAQIAAFAIAQLLVVAFYVSLWVVRRGPGEPDYDAYAD